MNFSTIDIEGDALSKDINQKLFPEGNHFDPGTRIWCVTFCDGADMSTETFVHRLDGIREVKEGVFTKAYHEKYYEVPATIIGRPVMEIPNVKDFLYQVYWKLVTMAPVYSKGYGKYNFDLQALYANFERAGLWTRPLEGTVKSVNTTRWNRTSSQVYTGGYKGNREYMMDGIRHNIEDSIQLAERIKNKEYK